MSENLDQLKLQIEPVSIIPLGLTQVRLTNSQKSSAISNNLNLTLESKVLLSIHIGANSLLFLNEERSISEEPTSKSRFSIMFLI